MEARQEQRIAADATDLCMRDLSIALTKSNHPHITLIVSYTCLIHSTNEIIQNTILLRESDAITN